MSRSTSEHYDDIDLEMDRYADYEAAFTERTRRKAKANHKPKKSQAQQLDSVAAVEGLEGGFNTTYRPGLFEGGWLLDSLRPFYDMGLMTDVLARVKGGKEANVYRVAGSPNAGADLLAAKVYRPAMFRTMKNDSAYREGRSTLNSDGHVIKQSNNRITRALKKKSDFGKAVAHGSWLMHEYGALQTLHEAGAAVPRPIAIASNAILMDYCGDDALAAPTLAEVRLTAKQARAAFDTVLETVQIMLRHGMVHGDLSAYNVLYWDDQPIVIDLPQVVEVDGNPNARSYLERDLERLTQYFGACGDDRDPHALVRELWIDAR
ncbi:MAG: hypothetical protein IPM16_16990 [Chloroflexi bacterium]|nr:hypothetical protein [Chloroflexota bacterium]